MGPDLVFCGADDEIRTRDPHLGKVMLYQLSYVRMRATEHSASDVGRHGVPVERRWGQLGIAADR